VEPLVNNDTPANRASNRRVDITVFNPVAGPALVRPGK
jgi:flagellar motor protein MotB